MKFKYRITAKVTVSRAIEIEVTSLKTLAQAQRDSMTGLESEIRLKLALDTRDPRVKVEQISLRPTDKRYA